MADKVLDCKGMHCPVPLVKLNGFLKEVESGDHVEVQATDPAFFPDIEAWSEHTGNPLVSKRTGADGVYVALIRKS
jgi:TusA-related sulfurtransferase